MHVQFVKKSSNGKIGPIPCTTTERSSCPPSCPLIGKGGCYAEAGYYTRLNWDAVSSGKRGTNWEGFVAEVAKLPLGQLWRHNIAGDLPSDGVNIDKQAMLSLVDANKNKRGFTYTHHKINRHNSAVIRKATRDGFTVNVSANNPAEAKQYRKRNLPTVTVVPTDYWQGDKRKGDIVRCPAEYRDDVTCSSCGLCARADRRDIVGFTAHGSRAAAANVIARG